VLRERRLRGAAFFVFEEAFARDARDVSLLFRAVLAAFDVFFLRVVFFLAIPKV
jgi:hypothetical protein